MGQTNSSPRGPGREPRREGVGADKALFGLGGDGGSLHRTEDGYLAVPPHGAYDRSGNVHMVVGSGPGNPSSAVAFVVKKPPRAEAPHAIERSIHEVQPSHYDQVKYEVAEAMGERWHKEMDAAALGGSAPGSAPP